MKPLAALLLLAACESGKPAPPAEARSGLRVPLPEGWKATAAAGGLQVGPPGRALLLLESTARPLPTPEALAAAVEREGVRDVQKESGDSFVGARYLVAEEGLRREAFLGVRALGERTVWCSTTGSPRAEEVEAAMKVCKTLTWEG